jgi:multicomponent Na+:H+ antiporter subunit D
MTLCRPRRDVPTAARPPHFVQVQKVLAPASPSIANLVVALTLLTYTLGGNGLSFQSGAVAGAFWHHSLRRCADRNHADDPPGCSALLIFPYALASTRSARERLGFYPMSLLLLMGVNGAFITGDLFNLYVFYEVLLMSSFVLLTLGGTPSQINAGIRYVVLNLMGSMMLLLAAGITYGTLGTLNMAQISQRMGEAPATVQAMIAGLLLIAFAGKAAMFPFFFWLPSAYHTPHPAVTALFSGALTKVGVYSLFRTFPLFFPDLLQSWQPLLFMTLPA